MVKIRGIMVATVGQKIPESLLAVLRTRDPHELSIEEEGRVALWEETEQNTKEIKSLAEAQSIDCFFLSEQQCKVPKLALADMDMTMIPIESLDLLAGYAGIYDEIARLTDLAMRGEMDFQKSLIARLSLLDNQPTELFQRVGSEIKLTPGAASFIGTLKALGCRCLLVTGGFMPIAKIVAERLGMDQVFANQVPSEGGRIKINQLIPPLIDQQAKGTILLDEQKRLGLSRDDVLAIGDGSNDLNMIEYAGLGISFHGKSILKQSADIHLGFNDLRALKYLPYMTGVWRKEAD